MITLTTERVIELLDGLVADYGADYVYDRTTTGNGCKNVWEGMPACIAGHVYVRAGIPIGSIPEATPVWDCIYTLDKAQIISFPDETVKEQVERVLATAQDEQDNGTPWGEAVAKAKAAATNDPEPSE